MSHGWSGNDSDSQIPLQDHSVAPAGYDGVPNAAGYGSSYPPRQTHASMTADEIWANEAGKEWRRSAPTSPAVEPRNRKRWWWFAGIAAVIIIAVAVAVPTAVVLSNKNKQSSSANDSSSSTGTDGTVSNSSDPSQFTKDSRLHNVFWGMAYDPEVRPGNARLRPLTWAGLYCPKLWSYTGQRYARHSNPLAIDDSSTTLQLEL